MDEAANNDIMNNDFVTDDMEASAVSAHSVSVNKQFKIGLALAGAISAGAYTAGVIDFMVEALEEWEKMRGQEGQPTHRTGLKVIAGASAGAITGALGLVALSREETRQELDAAEIAGSHRKAGEHYSAVRCVLPTLYRTWVEQPRLVAARDGDLDFLSGEDLAGAKSVVGSVLNSGLLDQIKAAALEAHETTRHVRRPYLAEKMHLYVTVSNLRGIPFQVDFGTGTYGMQTHGDRLHYMVQNLGSWQCADTEWVANDTTTILDAQKLPTSSSDEVPAKWDDYGTVALASAAFPIGLASRVISSPYSQYQGRSYPIDADAKFILKPHFPGITDFAEPYTFLNVDGGLINNNPFDYAEYALLDRPSKRGREKSAMETDSALIMVAPFPEPPAFLPEGQPRAELSAVIRALFPTLTTQARFRSSDLAKALDRDNYSRYLIAPHRKLPDSIKEAKYTIACGALGGFGGFLDEKFRAHDYQLGRRNCQQFLRETFALPHGAHAVDDMPQYRFMAKDTRTEQAPVIPLAGEAQLEVSLPCWPRMSESDLAKLGKRIEQRLNRLVPILIKSQTMSTRLRFVGLAGFWASRKRLLETVRLTILADLVRRNQVEGWDPPAIPKIAADDARAVVAELVSPAFDTRTAKGIAQSLHLPEGNVDTILGALRNARGNIAIWSPPWNAKQFTLRSRKPAGWQTWPGIASMDRWLNPPRVG